MADKKYNPVTPQYEIQDIRDALEYNMIADDLRLQFRTQTSSEPKDSTRVKLCYMYLKQYRLLVNKPYNTKCDLTALSLEVKGKDLYAKKKFEQSFEAFNNAVKYATQGTLLREIYANRSALLISMDMHESAIVDIDRALGISHDFINQKLFGRKALCEKAIEEKKVSSSGDVFDIKVIQKKLFSLPLKRMSGVPSASASIRISKFEQMGRGIVATDDIQAGQVLVSEEPYSIALSPDNEDNVPRCYYCFTVNYSMIPCEGCTCALFCNEICRERSIYLGHQYECPIMTRLTKMKFNSQELLSLKILLKARCQNTSLHTMFNYIEMIEREADYKSEGFQINDFYTNLYGSGTYAPIHLFDKRKNDEASTSSATITAAIMLQMLKDYTTFFGDHQSGVEDILSLDDDDYIWRVGGLLLHINMAMATCSAAIYNLKSELDADSRKNVHGVGTYALTGLFNHSCSPNVGRIFNGTTLHVIALHPIKNGEQLFDNYGMLFSKYPRQVRQEQMKKQFDFTCVCEACANDWPLFENLPKPTFKTKRAKCVYRNIIDANLIEKLQTGDKITAYRTVLDLYKYVTMLEDSIPCTDHVVLCEYIKFCWSVLLSDAKNINLKFLKIQHVQTV